MKEEFAEYPRVTDLGNNLIEIDYGPYAEITLAAIEAAYRKHLALKLPGKQGVLITANSLVRADREAQRFAGSDKICAVTRATALLATGFTSLHLAKMYLWFFRPPYPSSIFRTRKQALAWLNAQNAKHR